jgi:hypothetical protein
MSQQTPSADDIFVATEAEAAFVREHGDAGTARLLGFPRATAARIAGRLPVRAGSLALFRARLAAHRASKAEAS